jgi:hypothetical protein
VLSLYVFPYVHREWTVFRCPNGHEVARELKDMIQLGDPSVVCRTCGLAAQVDAYREWADLTPPQRRGVIVGYALAAVFAGSAFGIVLGAVAVIIGLFAGLPDDTLIALGALAFAAGVSVPVLRGAASVRASKRRALARP